MLSQLVLSGFLYTIVAIASIRKLLGIGEGLGHNWDSPFSPLAISYLSMLKNLPYVWNGQHSLGFPIISSISTKIWWLFNSTVGIVLKGSFVTQFMILFLMIGGGLLMFYYVRQILKTSGRSSLFFAPFCAGLFFMFSPVVFGHIVGGAFNQFFTMVVSLLLLIALQAGASRQNINRTSIEISLIFIFISVTLHNHLINIFITICYVSLLYSWTIKRKIELAAKTTMISLLLAAYWLFPEIYGLANSNIAQKLKENISFGNLVVNVPSISNALFANGYVRRFYDFMVIDGLYSIWKVAGLSLFFIIIASVFLVGETNFQVKKYSLFWFGLFLIFVNFATGFTGPLGSAIKFLYENFPPLSIFRSPQWWMMPLTICFAVLIGLSFERFASLLRFKLSTKLSLFTLLVFVLHPFYISGDLGIEKLYQRQLATTNWYKADHLDLYKVPGDYRKTIEILAKDDSDSKVLLLPLSLSPYFEVTSYQKQGSGVDPILAYLAPKPVIFNDINVEYDTKSTLLSPEKKLYRDRSLEFLNLLGVFNTKYILFKKDYSPVFSDYRNFWDGQTVYSLLTKNISQIGEIVENGESTLLVKLNDNLYWPHVYVPQNIFVVSGNPQSLSDIGSLVDDKKKSAVFFSEAVSGPQVSDPHDLDRENVSPSSLFVVGELIKKIKGYYRSKFDLKIPQAGEYKILAKNDLQDTNWKLVEEKYFEKGQTTYLLPEPKPINLVDKFGVITDYQYDTEYLVSFYYNDDNDNTILTVVEEGEKEKLVLDKLPRTEENFVLYQTVFRSTPRGLPAIISVSNEAVKDLRVEKVTSPQIILWKKGRVEMKDTPEVELVKINPTKYRITVKNATKPFVLIFSEAYNQGWKLRYMNRVISKASHKVVNGYANSWIVVPNEVGAKRDFELIIEFWPQKLFYIGLLISGFSLILTLSFLIKYANEKES